MIKRYALIENGKVENVIAWNTDNGDVQDLTPLMAVETEDAQPGDLYIDGQFIKPQTDTNDPGNTFEQ